MSGVGGRGKKREWGEGGRVRGWGVEKSCNENARGEREGRESDVRGTLPPLHQKTAERGKAGAWEGMPTKEAKVE